LKIVYFPIRGYLAGQPEGLPGREQAVEALHLAETVLQQVTESIQQKDEE
jgi:hypothetical protein